MPDDYGRYTLLELRQRVWRRLNALRADTIDPTTGKEGTIPGPDDPNTGAKTFLTPLSIDTQFTAEDVDGEINTSITGSFCNIVLNSDIVFGDEEYINIKKDITEYELPSDIFQLRGLFFKDPSILYTQLPVTERKLMYLVDSTTIPEDLPRDRPTYRMQLSGFVLNEVPKVDNPGGILVRYIKVINFLLQDGDVVESQYARIIQEIAHREAAIRLLESRSKLVIPDSWQSDLLTWQTRLNETAKNALNPPLIVLSGDHYIKNRRGRG